MLFSRFSSDGAFPLPQQTVYAVVTLLDHRLQDMRTEETSRPRQQDIAHRGSPDLIDALHCVPAQYVIRISGLLSSALFSPFFPRINCSSASGVLYVNRSA